MLIVVHLGLLWLCVTGKPPFSPYIELGACELRSSAGEPSQDFNENSCGNGESGVRGDRQGQSCGPVTI